MLSISCCLSLNLSVSLSQSLSLSLSLPLSPLSLQAFVGLFKMDQLNNFVLLLMGIIYLTSAFLSLAVALLYQPLPQPYLNLSLSLQTFVHLCKMDQLNVFVFLPNGIINMISVLLTMEYALKRAITMHQKIKKFL
jgi:hypothetical protein